MEMRSCECGCGMTIAARDAKNRPRRYVFGHHVGAPRTPKQIEASRKALAARRLAEPWNRGRTYAFARRVTYADTRTLGMAMKRVFLDRCMRCNWDEGSCDTHHITPRAKGGVHSMENAVILCPNCHRLVHEGKVVPDALRAIREAAIAINPII
jgi:hypothetical protein